ncbi:MAG TPA: hypothetical protein VF796_04400, partial [Humisphaera sp.]
MTDEVVYAELLRLKSRAEAEAIGGRPEVADATYRLLTLMADALPARTPRVFELLERTRSDHERIRQLVRSRAEQAAAPVVAPQAAARPDAQGQADAPPPLAAGGSSLLAPVTAPAAGPPPPPSTALAVQPAAVLSATTPTVPAAPPASRPTEVPPDGPAVAVVGGVALRAVDQALAADNPAVLDAEVERAIRAAADYLLRQFDARGELPSTRTPFQAIQQAGIHALCVYAVLSAGQAVDEPRYRSSDPTVARLIDRLKGLSLDEYAEPMAPPVTYARSLRAAALSVSGRAVDQAALRVDVAWLTAAHREGAYSYDDRIRDARPGTDVPPPPTAAGRLHARGAGRVPAAMTAAPPVPGPAGSVDSQGRSQPGPAPVRPEASRQATATHLTSGRPTAAGARGTGIATQLTPRWGLIHLCGVARADIISVMAQSSRRQAALADRRSPGSGAQALADRRRWDNFNAQLAVWAVYLGTDAGAPVGRQYWTDVAGHWARTGLKSGAWPLDEQDSSGSLAMTAGGLA